MSFWRSFNAGFYGGGASAAVEVGSRFDVAVGGVGYMIDWKQQGDGRYAMRSLPLLRSSQINQPANVGETSINPDDYWRRSAETWHLGAGQRFYDRNDADPARFRASKGVNVWEPGELTLLKDTDQEVSSSEATQFCAAVGTYLYYQVGNALKYATSLPTFTTVTAASGTISGPRALTSDGYTIWVNDGTRVYYTTRGNATYAAYHGSDHVAEMMKLVKGRLITGNNAALYTHSGAAGSAVATELFTHANSDWTWVDATGGPAAIYFAGYAGAHSAIYKTAITADGSGLAVPSVAADLPTGEIVRSIFAYLSVLVIGTDKGLRIAAMSDDGTLTLGNLIELNNAPKCFDAQGPYVWFGWKNYDASSTGLGRLNLATFTNDAPAYASDLMVTGQGEVTSLATFGGVRLLTVSGLGLYSESDDYVTSGTIESGWANFDLPDHKYASRFMVSARPGAGTVTVELASDSAPIPVQLGGTITTSADEGGEHTLPVSSHHALEFEWTLTLGGNGSGTPSLRRVTLFANPAAARRLIITVPLRLHEEQETNNRQTYKLNPIAERSRFEEWLQSQEVIAYQEPGVSYNVTVDGLQWVPLRAPGAARVYDGTMLAELKVF